MLNIYRTPFGLTSTMDLADQLRRVFALDGVENFGPNRLTWTLNGDHYLLSLDVPGFGAENLIVELVSHGESIRIHGKSKNKSFNRVVSLPLDAVGLEAASVRATVKHGVLTVKIPAENKRRLATEQIPVKEED